MGRATKAVLPVSEEAVLRTWMVVSGVAKKAQSGEAGAAEEGIEEPRDSRQRIFVLDDGDDTAAADR